MIAIFSASLALILYVYAGYPLLLRSGALGKPRPTKRDLHTLPLISVIVPAHNEEAAIEAKIRNILASDYPRERLDILIGSDGSSDRTEEIVRRFAGEGVGLVSFPQQHGKSAIQNGLVALASGEILVFTDADCFFAPGTLRTLIDNFADLTVGLVTARPEFENAGETGVTRNEGTYLRYETWLRREESARGLLALASGSLFAMRRKLWQPIDVSLGDDFALPLLIARRGFRNVVEPGAVASTRLTQSQAQSMFRMKTRIIAKDLRALIAYRDLLDPMRHGALAVALWSHKLLRWLVPYFLLGLLVSNALLLHANFFRAIFALQAAFYGAALCALLFHRALAKTFLSVAASFCIVNAAALIGTLQCLSGRTFALWKPARTSARPAHLESRSELP
jgi:cellulose synthase/poly-beta-1,6-N-acetylglucosamine synthase-like glycosyltransferase